MEESRWNWASSNSNAHDFCGIYCSFPFPFGGICEEKDKCGWWLFLQEMCWCVTSSINVNESWSPPAVCRYCSLASNVRHLTPAIIWVYRTNFIFLYSGRYRFFLDAIGEIIPVIFTVVKNIYRRHVTWIPMMEQSNRLVLIYCLNGVSQSMFLDFSLVEILDEVFKIIETMLFPHRCINIPPKAGCFASTDDSANLIYFEALIFCFVSELLIQTYIWGKCWRISVQ